MKDLIIRFTAFMIILTPSSIVLADDSPKEAAMEYCKCTKESNEQLAEAVKKIKAKDMVGASEILQKMEPKMKEMEACTSEIKKKYSADKMSEDLQKELVAEIDKNCPAPSMEGIDL